MKFEKIAFHFGIWVPAIISSDERNKGLSFFYKNNININNHFETNKNSNIKVLNELLEDNSNRNIIFSSGGFDTINNINQIGNNIGSGEKVLIGFSDTLHLQAKFYNNENIYNIYGLTLRNKFNNENNLFLACKREIENYYKKVGFEIIDENIPEKLEGTLRWGKENNFDAIIMKYNK